MGTIITTIVILFISLTGFFFLLRLFEQRKSKKLLTNYDEKENPSRREGKGRTEGIRTGQSSEVGPTRPSKPQRERVLQTTPASEPREEHPGHREVGKAGRILGRIRRRHKD